MCDLIITFLIAVGANVISNCIICDKDCPLAGGYLISRKWLDRNK